MHEQSTPRERPIARDGEGAVRPSPPVQETEAHTLHKESGRVIGYGAHLGACATMEARAGAADVEAIPQLGASTSASAEPASRARAARERVMWFLVSSSDVEKRPIFDCTSAWGV